MTIKNIIISIIVILVVFAVGGGAGVLYQQQKETPAPQAQTAEENSVMKILNSKTIPFVTAYGDVTDIDGKNITIIFGEDSLKIKVRDDAPVYSSESKIIKPENLKKGDRVSVNLKISQDGQAEGLAIVLITPAAK